MCNGNSSIVLTVLPIRNRYQGDGCPITVITTKEEINISRNPIFTLSPLFMPIRQNPHDYHNITKSWIITCLWVMWLDAVTDGSNWWRMTARCVV